MSKNILFWPLILGVFSVLFFAYSINTVSAYSDCKNGTMTLYEFRVAQQYGKFNFDVAGNGTAIFANQTDCSIPMSLVSWKVYGNTLADQKLYNNSTKTVAPGSVTHFNVSVPTCMAQIDLYYGGVPGSTPEGDVDYLIDYAYANNNGALWGNATDSGNICKNTQPPQPQTLSGSCLVNPSSVTVGGYLNWNATASGGDGYYTYIWSGSDGLAANSSASAISKAYFSAGTKTGTVTIKSGSQSVSYTCSAAVTQVIVDNNLNVSCSVDDSSVEVDEDVTYSASANGGSGSYSYNWSGSESLNGSSRNVTWSYDNDGTKNATVLVTDGTGQTKSASCSVRVKEEDDDEDLDVSCYANPSNPQIGQQMRWYADVDGGDGDYDYDWEGTDGLNSSSRSPSMTYYDGGTKTARVEVRSNGQRETATCRININQNSVLAFSQVNTPLESAVYLNQVPYTGVADNLGSLMFILVLALFSAYVAYVVVEYKKNQLNKR